MKKLLENQEIIDFDSTFFSTKDSSKCNSINSIPSFEKDSSLEKKPRVLTQKNKKSDFFNFCNPTALISSFEVENNTPTSKWKKLKILIYFHRS